MIEFFEGKKFKIQEGYFCRGNKRLHRLIWEKAYGPIPKGHHIHHKDGNRLNNSIENLECISHEEHLSLHMKENSEKIHVWHKSEEGRRHLGKKASKLMEERPFKDFKCPECLKDFKSQNVHRVKYCSINCQAGARRKRGDDNVERQCVICSQTFSVNRYSATKTCGYSCGAKFRSKNY